MTRAMPLMFILGLAATGCGPASHDNLLGWYRLPSYDANQRVLPGPGTLIPIFKRDGVYHSTCRGFEVPLKKSPDGLEWAPLPSSMEGTRVGLDQASGRPYILIRDLLRQGEWWEGMQFMERIEKPLWLLDPTTKPPKSLDDFLASFIPAWAPYFRWTVYKEGDKYGVRGEYLEEKGWKLHPEESAALIPLAGQLGLAWKKGKVSLIFSSALRRYECVMGDETSAKLRMPLVRTGGGHESPTVPPPMSIGIPSWH